MHDVAKTTTLDRKQTRGRRWIRAVLYALIAGLAITGLVFSKMAMMLMVITVISALVILFGWIAFRRFRAAANDGDECGCEGRKLGADAFRCGLNLRGPGRSPFH